jgi:hypothetical protein
MRRLRIKKKCNKCGFIGKSEEGLKIQNKSEQTDSVITCDAGENSSLHPGMNRMRNPDDFAIDIEAHLLIFNN